ncbi:MAG: carboxypeptidase-like regulatory domain-containing protein [Marinilabiliales bacterium]|nr:carboxypeptidase-like regulatory domain-containing protein [Marinilabiliales bacterium]
MVREVFVFHLPDAGCGHGRSSGQQLPAACITGRVSDAGGVPLAGASVVIDRYQVQEWRRAMTADMPCGDSVMAVMPCVSAFTGYEYL